MIYPVESVIHFSNNRDLTNIHTYNSKLKNFPENKLELTVYNNSSFGFDKFVRMICFRRLSCGVINKRLDILYKACTKEKHLDLNSLKKHYRQLDKLRDYDFGYRMIVRHSDMRSLFCG